MFECLATNLKRLGLPDLPDEYHRVRALLKAIEDGDEARLRYDTLKASTERSFGYDPRAEPKVASLGEISTLLRTIFSEQSRLSDPGDDPVSLMDHIHQHTVNLNYDIVDAVRRLEKRTKSNEVVWTIADTPRLDISKLGFKAGLKVVPVYLTTEYEGRCLIIFKIRGGEYSSFLTCLPSDGTLTRTLWPPEHHSNLPNAAADSWKRHDPGEASSMTAEEPTDV